MFNPLFIPAFKALKANLSSPLLESTPFLKAEVEKAVAWVQSLPSEQSLVEESAPATDLSDPMAADAVTSDTTSDSPTDGTVTP